MKIRFTIALFLLFALTVFGQEENAELRTPTDFLKTIPLKSITPTVTKKVTFYCYSTISITQEFDFYDIVYIYLREKVGINYSHYSDCPNWDINIYNKRGKTPELTMSIQDRY